MWLKFLAGVSLLLASPAPLVLAEQLQFRVGPVYTDRPGEVSVVVEFPPEVTPEASNFRLVDDDETVATAREIKPFRLSGQQLALVICVDVSGTMRGDPLKDTKQALLSFLGTARPEDRIGLISFADEDKIESSFEDARRHLAEAIRNLKTRGRYTRLYQTLYNSLDTLQGAKLPKRRRVIVISDGKDERSIEGPESVIVKSKALRIPIDAVGRGNLKDQYAEALRDLANPTGGGFVHARPDRVALTHAIGQIYGDLLETRSLVVYFTYKMDEAGRTTENALIELKLPGDKALTAVVPEAIPRRRPTVDWLFWLFLSVVLLGIGLFVWAILARRGTKNGGAEKAKEPETAKPRIRQQPVVATDPESQQMTLVGGYYFPIPERGKPTAILMGVGGPVEGQQYSVGKEIFHIGASPENDLHIMEDDYVSRNHAYLRYERGSLFIFDQGSRNGTFVNQNKVTDTGFVLGLGDRIRVGMSTFEVGKALS